MPIVLVAFGIALVFAGYHGNARQLFSQLGSEFQGPNGFGKWVLAIFLVGAVGYVKPLKPASDAFMVLLLVVLFLSNKGFFAALSEQTGIAP